MVETSPRAAAEGPQGARAGFAVGRQPRRKIAEHVARRILEVRHPEGIVCHRHRLVYFPVPKAACTTVKRLIARLEGLPADGNPHHDIPFEHIRADALDRLPGYARFTVVRNPFDRLVSCFKDKIQGRPRAGAMHYADGVSPGFARYNRLSFRKLFRPDMAFDEFARTVSRIPDLVADAHFRSQHRLIGRPDGTWLVDTIIRFERLHDELPAFLAEQGAAIDPMERRPDPDYAGYYDPATRARIASRYREDFRRLGYAESDG